MKITSKTSGPPLKDKTDESWAQKKERCKKSMENIFKNIITENFPTLGKEMVIQVQEAFRTPNRQDQKDPLQSML
jgi:hypothetical protein